MYEAKPILSGLWKRIRSRHAIDAVDLPLDFDATAYLELNPDLAQNAVNPYWHYATMGKTEMRPYKRPPEPPPPADVQELPEGFDPQEYRRLNPDLANYTGDLVEHYFRYGIFEFRKYCESELPAIPNAEKYSNVPKGFDPDVYLTLNPDIENAVFDAYEHFSAFGAQEGRKHRFPDVTACYGLPFDDTRPNLLLVSHEATRTGAPVLTWNIARRLTANHNVVVLLLGEGALLSNFQFDAHATYFIPEAKHNRDIAQNTVEVLQQRYGFAFAILNSIETGPLCMPLTACGVPNLVLVHEFAANTMPRDKFEFARIWSTQMVFSTELTKADAVSCFPGLFDDAPVLPQGQCAVPPNREVRQRQSYLDTATQPTALNYLDTGRQLVIGLGSVCIRKGVDLFIEVATRIESICGEQRFEFLWVGGGYPDYDPEYSTFLRDQMQRSGLGDRIHIVPETDDLDSLYGKAALMVLSSRLDPLPNVAIDAMCAGLPLVCFDRASGIADVLQTSGLGEHCVAAYMDTADMARKAVALLDQASSPGIRADILAVGQRSFSMAHYCERLIDFGAPLRERWTADHDTVVGVLQSGLFDPVYYRGKPLPRRNPQKAAEIFCWEYVLSTKTGTVNRKPGPGIHPMACKEQLHLARNQEPLLSLSGLRPHGSGLPTLITPDSPLPPEEVLPLRVALHVHAYYPDMLADILQRLNPNRCKPDLFITVDSESKFEQVKTELQRLGMEGAQVSVHANVGRDIYPFLRLCSTLAGQYDVLGHLHTKKSPHVTDDATLVPRWRELLLGTLLGGTHEERMLDRILVHMHAHPEIRIVFPDDPHVMGWGKNLAVAKQLVSPEEFDALPTQFDFPVGTMFWARSEYMSIFADLDLETRYSPREPLPIDGTILHACERLMGAKAAAGGYALTHVKELSR